MVEPNPIQKTSTLPKVFIEKWNMVKVALVDSFVNCAHYESRSGLTMSGCLMYDNGELKDTKGIYYILRRPLFVFYSANKKLTYDIEELKTIIIKQIQIMYQYLKPQSKLLIEYDNWGVSIYDRYIKGRILEFPFITWQGNLKVYMVPNPDIESDKKVSLIEIYNHTIKFDKEVIKYDITVFNGKAELICNKNDTSVEVDMKSRDHIDISFMLEPYKCYLFAHKKPNVYQD